MIIYVICIIIVLAIILLFLLIHNMNKYNVVSFNDSININNMPIVSFKHGRRKINFLVDTGSDFSYIDESIVKSLKVKKKEDSDSNIITATGYLKTSGSISIDLTYNGNTVEGDFVIGDIKDAMDSAFAPEIVVRGILGSIFLRKYKYIIDYNKNELKYKKRRSGSKVGTTF